MSAFVPDAAQAKVLEAVASRCKSVAVLGGAGMGKTTVALNAARNLVESRTDGIQSRVLFMTFSRSAVAQIQKKSPGILGGFDDLIEVMTFHALAFRIIQAFGKYSGMGVGPFKIVSETRMKVFGNREGGLTYKDLLPKALNIFRSNAMVASLFGTRWDLVVCDEVQDTSSEQWELLNYVSKGQLLLLGDPNQMIYNAFIDGVSKDQFDRIVASCECSITLDGSSHRDPTGDIPALANSVRSRNFSDPNIKIALKSGKLKIVQNVDFENQSRVLVEEIHSCWGNGIRDIGIFVHSNQGVSETSDILDKLNIPFTIIGTSELHAEALWLMLRQCEFCCGEIGLAELYEGFALFIASSVRSREIPALALGFLGRATLPVSLEELVKGLEQRLTACKGKRFEEAQTIISRSWGELRIASGATGWEAAAENFRRITSIYRSSSLDRNLLVILRREIENEMNDALILLDRSVQSGIKLMNFHQTKGREADTVIHLFRDGDYFGRQREPFEDASRLMNVAITRARKNVIVILPPNPHPLVDPYRSV